MNNQKSSPRQKNVPSRPCKIPLVNTLLVVETPPVHSNQNFHLNPNSATSKEPSAHENKRTSENKSKTGKGGGIAILLGIKVVAVNGQGGVYFFADFTVCNNTGLYKL